VARASGLGRGLAAILPESSAADAGELRELPVELVKPNPSQPRTRFDPEALAALAASIEASGVVQPLLVRPLPDGSYELVAGERRWRAARKAGLEKVPAIVRDSEQAERLQVALIENMVREDLNPVEEARACSALIEELSVSKEELGRRIGRSRSAISNLIRLLDLPDEALALLESGELSEGHGKALLTARGNDVRRRLARAAARHGWSVREIEGKAKLASQPKAVGGGRRHDPEEAEALRAVADRLESALGHEVRVRPARGEEIAVEIRLESLDDAHRLARRLSRHRGS
jgi:ParB family transcriptional regulator, chromosome partitioning protein